MDLSYYSRALLFMVFSSAFLLNAQTTLEFENFTQQNGLSSNYVLCFYQDKQGFMWIGTEYGLNRFDGQHFLHFKNDPEDSETLDDNWILNITEDSQNNIWIVTQKGLNRLDLKSGKIQRVPLKFPNPTDDSFAPQIKKKPSGQLQVFTGNALFDLRKPEGINDEWEAVEIKNYKPLKTFNDVKYPVITETEEVIWFIDNNAIKSLDILTDNIKTFELPDLASDRETIINKAVLDKARVVLFTQFKSYMVNINEGKAIIEVLHSFNSNVFTEELNFGVHVNFLKYKENTILITAYRNLYLYDYSTGNIEKIIIPGKNPEQSFPNFIRAPLIDEQGNVWLGTAGSGLFLSKNRTSPFTFYKNDPKDLNSISSGQVRSFVEDDQNLWVGILNYGMEQFGFENNDRIRKLQSFPGNDGINGLLPSNRIVKMISDSDQNIWLASLDQGVIKLNKTGTQIIKYEHQPGDNNSISSNRIWGLDLKFLLLDTNECSMGLANAPEHVQ